MNMNVSLRMEFYEDGVPLREDGIEFDHSQLVFNSNNSIKQLTLTNISNNTNEVRSVRFLPLGNQHGPFDECVRKNKHPVGVPPVEVTLNPKENAVAIISYKSGKNKKPMDRVAVNVDGYPEIIYIPVDAEKIDSTELDFGCIGSYYKTLGEITLVNLGSKLEDFKIEFKGSQMIVIEPTTGSVQPHGEQLIKVELRTKLPGDIEEKIQVTLGHETKFLHVRATFRELEDMLTQDLEGIPAPSAMLPAAARSKRTSSVCCIL